METIRKINDELAIAGQVSFAELEQIAAAGYKSVLNLRSPVEVGFQGSEERWTQLLGLQYVNFPIATTEINSLAILQVFQQLNELPKPILVHCDRAVRSATIVLIYIATRQGISLDRAFEQAINLGLL